jgi:predicted AlkP superfamily phosphohydrolase/phosphomutase
MIIGLDCAAPELLFDRWAGELPAIQSLIDRGRRGVLRSCDPPITVPAWSCMASSRSPGSLGVYGFRNRADHSYDKLRIADSSAIWAPRLWDLVSAARRPVIALGVPGTYPVSRVNGVMVSCFLTPDVEHHDYTYPRGFRHELERLVGRYMVDVDQYRTEDKARLLAELHEMMEKRFTVAEHLLDTRPWDLFFMVEIGTDRIHHGFWRYTDPGHRFYDPATEWTGAMLGYYRCLDERIARLLRFADEDTTVLLVSDHGAQRSDGAICVNEWLRRNGYLTLKANPTEAMPLDPGLIDWERTVAWGEGGYYCRLFLNVVGREPRGGVSPAAYEPLREELKAGLEAIPDDRGRPMSTVAHRPEDLYSTRRGVPPDLIVYFGDLRWRSSGQVGTGAIHALHNDTGPDDANHAPDGVYVMAGPGIEPGAGPTQSLLDVAPTVLTALGEPVPDAMEGVSCLAQEYAA